jgi:hypothetical protein
MRTSPKVSRILAELKRLAALPDTSAGAWLATAEEGVQFLKEHLGGEQTVLYASLNAVMIHGVLVPIQGLESINREEFSREFVSPDASWVIEHVSGGGEPDRVYLAPPLRRLGGSVESGEKLVFKRFFAGREGDTPIEISQKLVHALDLHFLEERNAWCRLDDDGDILEVIKIVRENNADWIHAVTVVTVLAKDFAEYMRLADMALLYFFDFTRTQPRSFSGWSGVAPVKFDAPDLFYHGGIMGQSGSYINGRMIVRPEVLYENIVNDYMERRNPSLRQYAVFKAIDLKTKKRIEVSANPEGLSNYFQPESTLPLEMSPAFFKAEVLHRYKADQVKYSLNDRSITCRGAWSLRTYDVNKEGQVHTYLRYLGELPYKEQLYWQSFNEWPKGGLSERAITTDFKGEFYRGYDPLNSLKRVTVELDERAPGWWQPRGEALRKVVHNPVTPSSAEWSDAVMLLDQLVNEGFLLAALRALAKSLGIVLQPDWRQFKLLEECVAAKSVNGVDAKELIDPLRRLRELRNHLKGHVSTRKQELAKQAIKAHGSFKAHFEHVADEVLETLKVLASILLNEKT